jgi:hypothetical protein
MKHVATFKILTSFNLTKLGVTAYGHIIEGKILSGFSATIDINGKPAKVRIKGLGMGRPDENGILNWCLILEFENSDLEKIAQIERIKEQTVALYTHDTNE